MTAYGYVRKSVMRDDTKTLSLEVQEQRIRALAAAKGDTDELEILTDAGISGAKVEERREYMRMVAAMESGEATAIYAYDLSRLHRNRLEAERFWALAEQRGIPIRLVAESIDSGTASGRMMRAVIGAMNAWMSEVSSEKIRASLTERRKQGHRLGGRLYGEQRTVEQRDGTTYTVGDGEDPAAVVTALREAGTLGGAAKLLNERGIPTRNRKTRTWHGSAVADIVERIDPDLVRERRAVGAAVPPTGAKAVPVHRFQRVLRCSVCGGRLVPSYDRQRATTRYFCRSYGVPGHARNAITERAVMPAIVAAVERTGIAVKRLKVTDAGDPAESAELAAKRQWLVDSLAAGYLSKDQHDAGMAEVDAALQAVASSRWVRRYRTPPDVEHGDPGKVNEYLRHTFSEIVVDMTQPSVHGKHVPVSATPIWRDPDLALGADEPQPVPGLVTLKSERVERRDGEVDVIEPTQGYRYETRTDDEIQRDDPEYAAHLREQEQRGA